MVSDQRIFRYDINALRGIAVLGVIFFHYNVPYFSGGFSGVDIFFVISGYLMSKIILTAIDSNNFSFKEFYIRRIKRIVPALLFLVFIITILCFFIYLPDEYQANSKNAASSLLFLSNIWYYQHSNYFDMASNTNIFLHTWSLSVEWQFYLLLPVALYFLKKICKPVKWFSAVFLVCTLVILVASIAITRKAPNSSFYLLPTRSWEMMIGGIAFLFKDAIKNYKIRKITAIVGYCLLLICLMLLNSSMSWPGFFTLLPVFGTFLIIIANFSDFKILKLKLVDLLGQISYSLYLWHWPVYVIAMYMGVKMNGTSIILLMILSVSLGYFSYRYIETIRIKRSYILVGLSFLSAFVIGLMSNHYTNKFMFKPFTLELANYFNDHLKEREKQLSIGCCFVYGDFDKFNKNKCLHLDSSRKNILLIGDSHGAHLSTSLRKRLLEDDINLMQATTSGCLPLLNPSGFVGSARLINYVYDDFIVKNKSHIHGVIISAHWINLPDNNKKQLLKDILVTIAFLKKYEIPVIILGQTEAYTIPYPSIIAKEYEYGYKESTLNNFLDHKAYNIDDFLSQNLKGYYIDIINHDSFPQFTSANSIPYMYDKDHLTDYGADLMTEKIFSNSITKRFIENAMK